MTSLWRLRCLPLLAMTTASALGAGSKTQGWPQWRGPTRDAISRETGLAKDWQARPPKVVWKGRVGIGFSSFAVSDGLAFTLGHTRGADTVYAFDAGSGAARWKHSYPSELRSLRHEGGPYATPTVDGGKVYVLSKLGLLMALEAATGRVLWQTNVCEATGTRAPRYGVGASPLVHGRLLILNVGPAGAAVDKTSGKLAGKSAGAGTPGHASPRHYTVGDRRGVAILAKGQVAGVDPADGRVLWRQTLPTRGLCYKIADPVFLGDRFLVTASYGDFCALFQLADGRVRTVWQTQNLLSKFLSAVVVDGHVVCSHRERDLRCIDPANGEIKWQERLPGSLIVVDGACLLLTIRGELLLADVSREAFRELGRTRVLTGKCWTSPALAGGRLYCRNAKGDVVCVELPRK